MDKLLKYEIKRKWTIVLVSSIALAFILFSGLVDGFGINSSRLFASTLKLDNLFKGVEFSKIGFISDLMWWITFIAGVDLYSWIVSEINYMLPINRGKVLVSKIIIYCCIYLIIDLIFIGSIWIKSGVSIDYRYYIVLAFITLTALMNLITSFNYIVFFSSFVSRVTIWFFIFINTLIGHIWFSIGKNLFYNKAVRLNLETMKFQSMRYVDSINKDRLNDLLVNEGLDLASLLLALAVGLIIFSWSYRFMEEKV